MSGLGLMTIRRAEKACPSDLDVWPWEIDEALSRQISAISNSARGTAETSTRVPRYTLGRHRQSDQLDPSAARS